MRNEEERCVRIVCVAKAGCGTVDAFRKTRLSHP